MKVTMTAKVNGREVVQDVSRRPTDLKIVHTLKDATTKQDISRLGLSDSEATALRDALNAALTPPTPVESVVRQDDCTLWDPTSLWGSIEAASPQRLINGTDEQLPYRRLIVQDGDDFYGERCELGRNERRYGLASATDKRGTFFLYNEGERFITSFDIRLPTTFPIALDKWQVVMQMKQTQPYATIPENTPILSLEARGGHFLLCSHGRVIWQGPAPTLGEWTPVELDVSYFTAGGLVQATIDHVASPLLTRFTLAQDTAGDPIPSHLRIGLYHDSSLPGTYADYRNIVVKKP